VRERTVLLTIKKWLKDGRERRESERERAREREREREREDGGRKVGFIDTKQ
jgi:hypothetical protein